MSKKAVVIGIKGLVLTKDEKRVLRKYKPWGVILFSRNIKSIVQTKKLTDDIRKIFNDKKYPILIDQEGGRVNRLINLIDSSNFTGEFFGKFFGGGGKATKTEGGGVAAAKPVSAAAGGIFTELTNVNVADAGKPEAVIPLDPAGIKVNHDDLLAKIDQLIAATNKVTGEVREMGVK